MNDRQQHEWIEKYLLGELSKREKEMFEERLQKDPAFSREVALQRLLHKSIMNDRALVFHDKLDRIKKEMDEPAVARRVGSFPWKTWLVMAASLAMLAVAAYFLFSEKSPAEPAGIFAFAEREEWPVYPNSLFPEVLVGGEARGAAPKGAEARIADIKQAYLSGDYQQALRALEQLSVDRVGRDRYFFYRGLLQMRSDQPVAAVTSFEQVGEGMYADVAAWNKALSLLAAGQPEAAVPILELMREKGFKSKEAEGLLNMVSTSER